MEVKDYLATIPALVLIAEDRFLGREYREDGWDKAPVAVMDEDRVMLPTIMVTTAEAIHQLGSPREAENRAVVVWALSNRSDQGHEDVSELLRIAKRALLGNESEHSPFGFVWSDGIGPYTASDGTLGYERFSRSHIPGE